MNLALHKQYSPTEIAKSLLGFTVSLSLRLYLHGSFSCCDYEKVSRLGTVCAADSGWNSAQALVCSQASCLCINPRHTL